MSGLVEQSVEEIPSLLLPGPVSELLSRRRWKEVPFLARWDNVCSWQASWPCLEWVAANKGLQYEPGPQEPSFIAADPGLLAYDLRLWMPAVVGALCCSESFTWYLLREPSFSVCVSVTC